MGSPLTTGTVTTEAQQETVGHPLSTGTARLRSRRSAALAGASLVAVAAAGVAALTGAGAANAAVTPAATPVCTTASLSAVVKAGAPGAGHRYATLVLTNTSRSGCVIRGYGGLALLGAPRQGVPTDLVRTGARSVHSIVLAPGASARSLLQWTAIPTSNEHRGEPTAPTVAVTPPRQHSALLIPWGQGPVNDHGQITQRPYTAGSAAF